jgi:hypothetical protein
MVQVSVGLLKVFLSCGLFKCKSNGGANGRSDRYNREGAPHDGLHSEPAADTQVKTALLFNFAGSRPSEMSE